MSIVNILKKYQVLFAVCASLSLGYITSNSSFLKVGYALGIGMWVLGLFFVYVNRNKNGEAHLFSGFLMASEVYYRMIWSGLPWEFSKYAIISLLSLALIVEHNNRPRPWSIVMYFLLMLPAVYTAFDYFSDMGEIFTETRKRVTFNLFGPLILALSTFYFYKRRFTLDEFTLFSRWLIYAMIMMSICVYFRVGDYTAIQYTYSSNIYSSGGFSGNQVSLAFGFAVLIIGMNIIIGNKIIFHTLVDVLLLVIFIFQGLMTFSRGGLMGGILALGLSAIVFYFSNLEKFIAFLKVHFIKLVLAVAIGTAAFSYTNELTGGYLYARYFNIANDGYAVKDDITTGRGSIGSGDFDLFVSSDFTGVGPGVSMYERNTMRGFAPHIEFTRMLAEHGGLGLISLIIMLLLPFRFFMNIFSNSNNKIIFTALVLFSLISMTHAAMRLAMIPFVYGMAFVYIVNNQDEEDTTESEEV